MSGIIFSAIVYIVMFVLLLALAGVIGILLNVIEKLPVLKQINKLAGGAAGLVKGLLIVWIAAILVMILSNTPIGIKIAADIDGNVFLKFLYDKNLIMYFLTGGKIFNTWGLKNDRNNYTFNRYCFYWISSNRNDSGTICF